MSLETEFIQPELQNNKMSYYINTLLLLLVRPIYLSLCIGVHSIHIHPYMSKSSFLLETNDEIMSYIYSGSLRAPDHDPRCWCYGTGQKAYRRWVLLYAHHECNKR